MSKSTLGLGFVASPAQRAKSWCNLGMNGTDATKNTNAGVEDGRGTQTAYLCEGCCSDYPLEAWNSASTGLMSLKAS